MLFYATFLIGCRVGISPPLLWLIGGLRPPYVIYVIIVRWRRPLGRHRNH